MERAIVFGLGRVYDTVKGWVGANYDVIALTDNNPQKRKDRSKEGLVIQPEQMLEYDFDCVVITASTSYADGIRRQCEEAMGIAAERLVVPVYWLSSYRMGDVCEYNGIKVKINSCWEMLAFQEVFQQRQYQAPPSIQNDYIVIDIGMNIGAASLYYASFPNVKKVYSYELFESTYQMALANFALNPHISSKIAAHPFGIGGGGSKSLTLKRTANTIVGNMFNLISTTDLTERPQDAAVCTVKGASETLREAISSHPEEKLIMKIDCEGAEWEIFDDLSQSGLLANFSLIVGEWHLPHVDDRMAAMTKFILQSEAAGLRMTKLTGAPFSGGDHGMFVLHPL
ncbi:MAG: FkbM family methyltransferase [Lachnospiraceae bacterium]|jgi:FkbM family methyltransferase|nr:FkbM family methyltransferase [Lachnospiraceae bacterium]